MYQCLIDNNALKEENNGLICPRCNHIYSKYQDIPVFVKLLDGEELRQQKIYSIRSDSLTSIDFLVEPLSLNHFSRKEYMDLLMINPDMKILDVGTQDGVHLRYLKHKYPELNNKNLYGIDITLSGLLIGKKENKDFQYSLSSVYELPFQDEFFDVVIINGVIEHLEFSAKGDTEYFESIKEERTVCRVFLRERLWTIISHDN